MIKRRDFIKFSGLSLPLVWLTPRSLNHVNKGRKAVVLSTWNSGLPVNKVAWDIIKDGGKSIDAVEQAGIYIENEISCCVGLGGNPDRDGFVTLDACIMDHQFNCGSVAFLQKIKNPVAVARKIMDTTPHVMLVGEGAKKFALEHGFPEESGELSPDAAKTYTEWLKKSEYKPVINIEKNEKGPFAPSRLPDGNFNHDTMGTICADTFGNLSGMCTTSGMGFKMHGRVGDSPIIGSGLYVDNEIGAATGSGQGEEVIRVCGTHLIVEFMRQGNTPEEACRKTIERIVKINPVKAKNFQVGFIALNKNGDFGAFSLQPGFNFSVTYANGESEILDAESYFKT